MHGPSSSPEPPFFSFVKISISIFFTSLKRSTSLTEEERKHIRELNTLTEDTYFQFLKTTAGTVYTTAGIHPCSSAIFGTKPPHAHHDDANNGSSIPCDPDTSKPLSEEDDNEPDAARTATIISELEALITSARSSPPSPTNPNTSTSTSTSTKKTRHRPPLVALGEFGLDYDRLHYCSRRLQLHAFRAQLDLAARLEPPLPLFLHSRAAHGDFVALLRERFGDGLERLRKGAVVHSFTGTAEELRELLELGLHVGVNGCSLKTAENCDVVRDVVGLGRLMLETDGPWCEIRPSHEAWRFLVEAAKRDVAAAAAAAAAAVTNSETTTTATGAGEQATTSVATAALAPAFTTAPSETPSGTSTPASVSASGTSTPSAAAIAPKPPKPQQQQKSRKKQPPPKKKEPEVPERFKTVKKEKWVEGAMVKSRNEPCMIERVAVGVAGIKGVGVEVLCEAAWRNTVGVFDLEEEGEGEEEEDS